MELINPERALQEAKPMLNREVYIHFEVNPQGYWRNGKAVLKELHMKGDGPYRLFLTLDDSVSLIQMNGLTHMEKWQDALIFTGYDDQGRIAQTIEISSTPFSV